MEANSVVVIGTIEIEGGPPRQCKIVGLSVDVPGVPPTIWGPTDPRPTPPIVIPNPPTEPPLVIWGPDDPRPTLPIYWPGFPHWPPTQPSPQPPPDKWYWHYCEGTGWVLVPPGGGGKPQPIP